MSRANRGVTQKSAAEALLWEQKLTEKQRRRRLLGVTALILLGLPLYIIAVSLSLSAFARPHWALEMVIYFTFGIAWALPLKPLVIGLGRTTPVQEESTEAQN